MSGKKKIICRTKNGVGTVRDIRMRRRKEKKK